MISVPGRNIMESAAQADLCTSIFHFVRRHTFNSTVSTPGINAGASTTPRSKSRPRRAYRQCGQFKFHIILSVEKTVQQAII